MTNRSIDWEAVKNALEGIECITDPNQLAKLSLDYFHFSPVLQKQLSEKRGDLVVRPADEAQVLQVARTCVKHRMPLTVRGAGTGNYGQCVPLEGGIILDTTKTNAIRQILPGRAVLEPGVKLAAFDKEARKLGWELRMYPSTYRTATIGGFIGGGSGGIGSITYGQLRDRGNLYRLRVVTLEDEPRVVELEGEATQQANHAYGTNGIITELEIPLAPAYPWAEAIAVFEDFAIAARFGLALSEADGIAKKLVCICARPVPSYFAALQEALPEGRHCALVMVSEYSLAPFQEVVREFGGEITYLKSAEQASKGVALGEFTWNHTTLHARSVDTNFTYLQCVYPDLAAVERFCRHYGDELAMHLEFMRLGGRLVIGSLPLVRYTTEERLNEIICHHEENGVFVANPHTYILEDGGMKTIDRAQLNFKKQVDPYGLLNPGKMRAWWEGDRPNP